LSQVSSRSFDLRPLTRLTVAAVALGSLACAERVNRPIKSLPVAVLGNSDSHSYQDSLLLRGPTSRGGTYRSVTYQWTEIWMRLRGNEVDLGAWGIWGSRWKIARVVQGLGVAARAPRKQDYEYNFAVSGARCGHLLDEGYPQVPSLLRVTNRDRERWAQGIVIIRIGINSFGLTNQLDEYGTRGLDASARERVMNCVSAIERTVQLIRSRYPMVHIVLVPISDDTNLASNLDRWRDPAALARIDAVLSLFEDQLRAMAERDPRMAFLDERGWFRQQWGSRSSDGAPAYRSISLGGPVPVTNSMGDHPRHLTLSDGHAGTVSNGLWLMNLVELLNARWALGLTPITGDEIARLADPEGRLGLRSTPKGSSQ